MNTIQPSSVTSERSPKLPAIYIPAFWRCTTPVDEAIESIGVAFDTPTGTVRLTLPIDHARQLSESISDYLRAHDAQVHSCHSTKGVS